MPWECKMKAICEFSGDLALYRCTYRIRCQDFAILANDDTVQRHDLWMRMVREFRRRKLTFGKDRLLPCPVLPALRSIAMPILGDYLAGCGDSFLVE
jgi:hypothetical protein